VSDTYGPPCFSIDVYGALTRERFDQIHRILNLPPARFKGWSEHFVFEPANAIQSANLTAFLRDQQLSHEVTQTRRWR
jgi:hypothetical protein